jgi:hypothetical protein
MWQSAEMHHFPAGRKQNLFCFQMPIDSGFSFHPLYNALDCKFSFCTFHIRVTDYLKKIINTIVFLLEKHNKSHRWEDNITMDLKEIG